MPYGTRAFVFSRIRMYIYLYAMKTQWTNIMHIFNTYSPIRTVTVYILHIMVLMNFQYYFHSIQYYTSCTSYICNIAFNNSADKG